MTDRLVFIADLNEVQDGDLVPVAMDFTVNNGPGVRVSTLRQPRKGEWVRIHSDSDDTLYYARVTERMSERDLMVKIDWGSCTPVLNSLEWSARDAQATSGVVVSSV
jgi:hypothetical protein